MWEPPAVDVEINALSDYWLPDATGPVDNHAGLVLGLPAPSARRGLMYLALCLGWLAFGEDSKAPAPEGFSAWLATRRETTSSRPVGVIRIEDLEPVPRSKPAGKKRRSR